MSKKSALFTPTPVSLKDGKSATVRQLSTDDGEALARFYATVPQEDYRFYCPHPLTREKALEKTARADSPTFVCLVLEIPAGEIGGYAWYDWKEESSQRSVFGICIRRDCQGSGAGRVLMNNLLEIGRKYGPPIMTLTVQKANPRGVALYTKMGFQVVREQLRKHDQEPEYAMEQPMRQS